MKIKGKKIWITALMAVIITVLLVMTYQYHINAPLKGMKVHLNDEEVYSFLQKEDIERLFIHDKNVNVQLLTIKTADLESLETIAMAHPWVESAHMYIDNGRYLNIEVQQRIPIARLFDVQQGSYYLDSNSSVMPVVDGYSYPVVVFTNVPKTKNEKELNSIQEQILFLAKFINADTFWSKQIVQVNMASKAKFELATLLGNQKVIIGDTSALATKFSNLMTFYRQVSNPLGWDKYTEINVSYLNQVVASPSLGWVPPKPVDTAVRMPDELKETELINTLPERPMEEAKGIQKEEKSVPGNFKAIPPKRNTEEEAQKVKDSTKIV